MIQKSKDPSVILTALGTTRATGEATVFVCDLDMFVQVQLLRESPALLSLGKLCEENGYSCEWHPGQTSHLVNNGETKNVKPTTTFPWWCQACKQPNTRPKLWATRSKHRLWATTSDVWKQNYQSGFNFHGRIDEVIVKFGRRLSS